VLKGIARRLRAIVGAERLPSPSTEETRLLAGLRAAFRELPVRETAAATPSEAAWAANMSRLRDLVLSRDPREFLRWDVISDTMFVSGADYVSTELKFLEGRSDWDPRWREAIRESPVGRPVPCRFHPASSGNLIHHAYHVARFEEKTAVRVRDLDFVFEFGGGYGSMCRLFHSLGFRGKYVIYDLPPFAALQAYFLESLGLPVQGASEAATPRAGIACLSDLGSLRAALGEHVQAGNGALFLATWSVSESPVVVRSAVLPLAARFGSFLIAYQDRFGEVDNVEFFAGWRKTIGGVAWHAWPIEHLPGNHYLVGSRASRAG
jgi:hypothetical protein